MAPLVEQQKTTESDALMAEHPDEQYASTETNSNSNSNSSENNSDIQQDAKDSVYKLRDLPLNDSPRNMNGAPNVDETLIKTYKTIVNSLPYYRRDCNQLQSPSRASSFFSKEQEMDITGLYHCQKCEFVGHNDDELHGHSIKHDPYECDYCGFLSDSVENLITHIEADHPKIPASKREDYVIFHEPEPLETSTKPVKSSPKIKKPISLEALLASYAKPRKTPCKICKVFVGKNKLEYFEHLRKEHSDCRLLPCIVEMCPFIALYKHHLEYHLRNHFGSKPFECEKCGYLCVNRSMLNSHLKSHSDIYQYSCKNCQYATKYLHSLKMHLKKYGHEHGVVLNPDGTVNKNAMVDTYGKKRGPRSQKRKSEADHTKERGESPKSKSSPSPPSACFLPIMPPQDIRILFNPQIHNNYAGNLCVRPSEATNYVLHSPPSVGGSIKCSTCGFLASSFEMYHCHLLSHSAQDRFSVNPFYQQPFASSPFQPSLHTNSFSRNIVNQPTTVGKKNINEDQNMDIMRTWCPISNWKYYEDHMNNGRTQTGESECRFPIHPPMLANNTAINSQYIGEQALRTVEKFLKLNCPSPNGIPTVKEEIPTVKEEFMNGIGNPSTKNLIDNGPLDLTIKQPTPPEKKSFETGARRGLIGGTMNRASSVSAKFGNEEESKVNTRKPNRRKGRAFKLNQYEMEREPLSDGTETGSRVFYENTFSNQTSLKPAVGKSVPRINFKPTLNATKWNGHDSQEPEQSFSPFPKPSSCDPQTTGQKARDASNDCWCPHCDMYSASPRLQEYHSSYHSKIDPFTCAKCGLRCFDKDRFNYHIILGSRINGTCINSIEEC